MLNYLNIYVYHTTNVGEILQQLTGIHTPPIHVILLSIALNINVFVFLKSFIITYTKVQ